MEPLDIQTDTDTALCPSCEEEYTLPEDTEYCPVCGSQDLTFTF